MAERQGEVIPHAYTMNQISDAANAAANDILAVIVPDELTTDLVNLVVNVTLNYVEHPGNGLSDAIEANYDDEDVETVLGWVDGMLPTSSE